MIGATFKVNNDVKNKILSYLIGNSYLLNPQGGHTEYFYQRGFVISPQADGLIIYGKNDVKKEKEFSKLKKIVGAE